MVWSYLFAPRPSGPEPGASPTAVVSEEAGSNANAGDEVAADTSGSSQALDRQQAGGEDPEYSSAQLNAVEETIARIAGEREEQVVIETSTARVELSSRGGQIRSFELKGYKDGEGNPLDLIRERSGGVHAFAIVDEDGRAVAVNDAFFQLERESVDGGEAVVFRYQGEEGRATKRFVFPETGFFSVEVEYQGVGRSGEEWGVVLGPGVENPTWERIEQPQFWRGGTYRAKGETERVDARKTREVEEILGRQVAWAALDDQYFLKALIPGAGVELLTFEPYLIGRGDEEAEKVQITEAIPFPKDSDLEEDQAEMIRELLLVAWSDGPALGAENYWGAKVYDELKELPLGLESAVDYGFFGFLARPLQIALNWVHRNVVANYGWAIVITTLLIRLLLLPLTHQAMASGQKMQELNPKIKGIRAKYRKKLKDKQGRPNMEAQQQMQQEIMAVYKQAGVNPAMGCLPMLVQIPVFFAFYELLKGAIELRQAPWLGWITDLSVMDPYYALPLVMFASQFVQQLRMPMGVDPMQRRLFLIMPFIFLFVFLQFPAGLVLYWLTSNIVSIVQQEVYRKIRAQKALAEGAKG